MSLNSFLLQKTSLFLLAVTFSISTLLAFGYPLYFDRLIAAVFLGMVAFYRVDKNVFTIGVICLLGKVLDELIFFFPKDYHDLPLYLILFYFAWRYRYDPVSRYMLAPISVLCLAAQVYWLVVDYQSPYLLSYCFLICANLIVRQWIFLRVHVAKSFKVQSLFGVPLDYNLYRLAYASSAVVTLMLLEYLVRHLTQFNTLVVYNLYSYVQHVISLFTLHFILIHIYSSKDRFRA